MLVLTRKLGQSIIINDNIEALSAAGEEIAAVSEEGATVSASAVSNMDKVNHELRQVHKLSEKLMNTL